jgi:hypothetical protein
VLYYLPGFAAPMATAGLTEYQRFSPDLWMPLPWSFSARGDDGKAFPFGGLSQSFLAMN